MKKFYTMTLCAAVALAAAAEVPVLQESSSIEKAPKALFQKKEVAGIKNLPAKAPAKVAAQVADVVGDYELYYVVELQGGSPYSGEMSVSAGTAENTVVFNFPFINGSSTFTWKLTGTLDPETGEITILADQPSGFTGAVDSFMHWNGASYEAIDEITAVYNGSAIVFDEDDAMGLQAASGGWYTLFDMITMDKIVEDPNVDPNEGWTSLGNATFVDPWAVTAFTFNDGSTNWDHPWEVELQQNDEDENLYRLVDPYFASDCPILSLNESTATHGYIQFNVSDPDHVYFDLVEAGFARSSMGISKFYCHNVLTYYMDRSGYSADYIVGVLGETIPYTTFKEGVVSLGSLEDEEGVSYDACFGIQGAIGGAYSWQDNAGNSAEMTGQIVFPGVDPSAVSKIEKADALVEYYNVNGMRVNNPAAGQLVIRRQGSEVTKVIVK